ncbi:MAG: Rpp14/Pop5 family protein [Nitrososphaerales archaeon]
MMLRRREKRRYLTVLVKREELMKLSQSSKNSSNSQQSNTSSANGSNTVETKSLGLTQQQQSVSSFQRHNSSKLKSNKQNNFYSKKGEQQEIDPSKILLKIIKKRFSELFGFVELEKSNIQTIRVKKIKIDDIFVVKCNLGAIDKLLFTLLMCKPLITTLKTSGTLRKLGSEIDSTIIIFNG